MAAERNMVVSVITRVVVCAALLATAAGVFAWLASTRPHPAAADDDARVPRVLVMRADPVPVRRQFSGYGTARAMDAADVPAQVGAVVAGIPPGILDGAPVARGQLLAQLDDRDFASQVKVSEQTIADLEAQVSRLEVEERSWRERAALAAEDVRLAEAELQRARDALSRGAANQLDVDRATQLAVSARRTEVAAREEMDKIPSRRASLLAQSSREQSLLEVAKLNRERCRIESPLEGVIQSLDVKEGENLMPGARVARVVSLKRIEVPLRLPATARAHVAVGDSVGLAAEGGDGGGPEWRAKVSRVAPDDDPGTRTMSVFVEVSQDPARGPLLAPGAFVQGIVTVAAAQARSVVPQRAIRNGRLWVVEDGKAMSRAAATDFQLAGELPSLGLPDRQWAVLAEPLAPGTLVVVNISSALAEGIRVTPVDATTAIAELSSPRAREPQP